MRPNKKCPACRKLDKGSCDKCRESKRLSQARRVARMKSAGLCKCGQKPMPGKLACKKCYLYYRRPKTGNCTGCNAKRGTKPFMELKNQCNECNAAKAKIHRSKHGNYTERHEVYVQSNFRNWFIVLVISSRSMKKVKRGDLKHTITVDDVLDILNKQESRCAITNIPMTHTRHNLRSASIDRIDSSKGYTKDNIQIVCRAINFAKSDRPNSEIKEFIEEIKSA